MRVTPSGLRVSYNDYDNGNDNSNVSAQLN